MILRKPYAFLIRNFKVVHMFLLALMVYVGYKSINMYNFFNAYSKTSYGFFESTLSSTLANPLFYVCNILIVLLSLSVMVLMKQKDKPTRLYVFISILYAVLIILLYNNSSYLLKVNITELVPRTSRMLKDINLIAILPQAVLIIMVLIRTVGFDIKKFNFVQDIEELQIDVSDDEEFELTIGTDSQKINKILNKNKRELTYFYLENKALIISVLVIIFVLISGLIYNQVAIVNKIYNQKDAVRLNNMSYKIDGIYSTNLNYKSNNISEGDNTFIVLKMSFFNSGKTNKRIKTNFLNLIIDETYYLPIFRKYDEFADIGIGYDDQVMGPGAKETYIFVYKVSLDDINKKMMLSYSESINTNSSMFGNNQIKYYVAPENIDKISPFPAAKLGKEVDYSISNIKKTKLTIKSIEFNDKYSIKSNDLINVINDPLDNKKIMKISYDYTPDKDIRGIGTFIDLLHKYGTIKYEKDGKTKIIKYVNLTPKKYGESDLFLSVPSEVENAEKIELIVSVRNLVYIHNLK